MTIDWNALIDTVFRPRSSDPGAAATRPAETLVVAVDLPDDTVSDHEAWRDRRDLAREWARQLDAALEIDVHLAAYRNAHTNNGDLPRDVRVLPVDATLPDHAAALVDDPDLSPHAAEPFDDLFARATIFLFPTEFSATAPLKLAARRHGFRAASMPRFSRAMIGALALDWEAVDSRCRALAELLDRAESASFRFLVENAVEGGDEHALELDLRHRSATASGGLLRAPGTAGNLPSGETYIVPYEGEAGEPSRSSGTLPVQFGDEVVVYRIEANRATAVVTRGERSREEADRLAAEPAYGNLAELGLGVLADFGVEPMGEILVDEKLGLHIAFGRSDHFGGAVGAKDFSTPDAVVHIDRVYLPQTQPRVRAASVDLRLDQGQGLDQGEIVPLMRDGRYVIDFGG